MMNTHPVDVRLRVHRGWPDGVVTAHVPGWNGTVVSVPRGKARDAAYELQRGEWLVAGRRARGYSSFEAVAEQDFAAFARNALRNAPTEPTLVAGARNLPPLTEEQAIDVATWLTALGSGGDLPSPPLPFHELRGLALAFTILGITLRRPPDFGAPHGTADALEVSISRPAFGVHARAIYTATGMTVLAGSTLRRDTARTLMPAAQEARNRLLESRALTESNDAYELLHDTAFSSPSNAASAITGATTNGWDAWQTEAGQSLREAMQRRPHRSPRWRRKKPLPPGNTVPTQPDDEPVCEHCAGEVLPGNRFCCDACEDDHETMRAFMGKDEEGSTYTLDGRPIWLADLFNDNPDLPQDERDAILTLESGDELVLGAGVGAAFLLRRES
jgi:hypothetical protein